MYIPDINKTAGKLNVYTRHQQNSWEELNVYTRHQQNRWEVKCIYQTSTKQLGS